MGAQTKITITHDVADVAGDLQSKGITSQMTNKAHVNWLQTLLNAIAGGIKNATVGTVIDKGDGVAATGTVTFSAQATANDTVVINGVTFTAVASGATGNQWNVGANATATVAALAAAINASATAAIVKHIVASPAAGVLTLTSLSASDLGNAVTLAKGTDAGTVMTVGGVSNGRLSGGLNPTGGSSVSYAFGL